MKIFTNYLIIFFLVIASINSSAQNGLNYDGVNDYVQTTYGGVLGSADRTFEAWVYVDLGAPAASLAIVDYGANAAGSRNTFMVATNRGLSFIAGGTNTNISSTAGGLIPDTTWTHVAFVKNAGTGYLYVNGVQVGSGNVSGVTTATGGTGLRIGQRVTGGSLPFGGKIDEVRIWNVARSTAEIAANMNSEFCLLPTGLTAYYKFNSGTAGGANTSVTTATDEVAAANGTLLNFTLTTGTTSNWVTGKTLAPGLGGTSALTIASCGAYTSPANHIYTTSGTYYDTLSTTSGCDSIITINLTIGVSPVTNLTASAITSSSATLSWTAVSGAAGYEYVLDQVATNPTGAGTNTTSTTYNASLLSSLTTYYMHVRTTCGGSFSTWTTTSFTTLCNPPAVLTTTPGDRCGPGTVMLSATGAGTVLNWYSAATGGSILATGTSFTTPSISVNTSYYVSAANGTSCESGRTAVLATIKPIPTVSLGNDSLICPGTTYNLTPSSNTTGLSYLWNNAATTSSISVTTAGQYWVTVTKNGCFNSDTIQFGMAPQPLKVLPDTFKICAGGSTIIDAGNVGAAFLWNSGATTQTISASSAGSYRVKITNSNNCVVRDTAIGVIKALPIVNLGNDTTICPTATIVLDAKNAGSSFAWSTGATTQTINANQAGPYSVIVTDMDNCSNSDEKIIFVFDDIVIDGFIFIPRFELQAGRVDFNPINPVGVNGYLWDFGDGTSSTSANPSHLYSTSANYLVKLTVSNPCGTKEVSQMIYVDLQLGVKSLSASTVKLDLYPIPTQQELSISTADEGVKILAVSATSATGKTVLQEQFKGMKEVKLNTANLTEGTYFLKIETNQGISYRKINVVR